MTKNSSLLCREEFFLQISFNEKSTNHIKTIRGFSFKVVIRFIFSAF